jgi:hypothetical protein
MRYVGLTLVVLAALALVTGASAGRNLSTMTLRLADLPNGYTQSKSSSCSLACAKRDQGYVAPGFVTGWERDFVGGPKKILSSVSLYRSSTLARASVHHSWSSAAASHCLRASLSQRIGSESRMYRCDESGAFVWTVIWRSGALKGAVILAGFTAGGAEAATLALTQQARMT